MTDPYGVDSRILEQSILSPRSESRAGIGFGSPRAFPFKAGALGSDWSLNAGPWSVVPYEGFLRFQGNIPGVTGGGNRAKASIARPFSLNQTSVTVAFSLRFNQVSIADSSGGFFFEFAPGLVLDWGNEGTNASYVYTDSDSSLVHLAPSTIKADGKWHRIVVSIQQGTVMLWEDDQLVLTWAPVPSLEDVVQASFGVSTNGVTASVDVGDVTVLVGTTQRARLRIADSDQSAFRTRLPYLQGLASSVPSVRQAALSISNSLRNIEIGPSAFFWGLDISPSIQQLAKSLQSDQRVSRLMTSATQGAGVPTGSSPTIYLGVGVTVSYYISGGVSIGLYMGSGQNGYTVAALTASGGLVTNVGVQDAFEFGISWLKPDDLMGLGQYMQIDGGEFIQGSIGAAGNAPLDMAHFSNCGPALSLGIGLSSSPVDLAAGLSYTWSMAKF